MSDPYQPPGRPPAADRRPANGVALYTPQGIVVGTIFGSLAAGVVMLYLNYVALGRANLARTVGVWGFAIFITIILIASFTPTTAGFSLLFMGIQAGVAYFMAATLQGAAIRYHQEHNGQIHSNLRAVGIGFLTGLGLVVALMLGTALWMVVTGEVPQPATSPSAMPEGTGS